MFFISTDNKLYYRGENRNGRGCVGHTNRVLDFEEVNLIDSDGDKINVEDIVDFAEYDQSSAFLLKDGSVYYTYSTGILRKTNIKDIIQICASQGTLFLLNKNGELFRATSGTSNPIQITNNLEGTTVKKIKKIGSSNLIYGGNNYGLTYYIDVDDNLYTFGFDFINKTSRSNYFCFCLKNVFMASGLTTSIASNNSLYALTKTGDVYSYGKASGIGVEVASLTNITDYKNFKTFNTNDFMGDNNIVDIIHMPHYQVVIVYKSNGVLKYSLASSTTNSYVSGETVATSNKLHEIIPNENNFNFDRFELEIMIDTAYPMMYMWEKETGDLYMAGQDYTASTVSTETPLTKVELPEGRKVKRPTKSKLYHNYKDLTVPTFDPVVTVSMFPEGAFNKDNAGFKVWDGEKYDRALFVDELEELYEIDITKAKNPTKINTSSGVRTLATVNMILYPKWIEEESDDKSIVGKAIVGKTLLGKV